jgi:hypothetical protein
VIIVHLKYISDCWVGDRIEEDVVDEIGNLDSIIKLSVVI